MGKRIALRAEDELERRLLLDVAAAPDGKERAALEALGLSRRHRIDDMWAGSPMRVAEATKIAAWLGYELRLVPLVKTFKDAPAYRDHGAFLGSKAQRKARAAPREKRRASSSSR